MSMTVKFAVAYILFVIPLVAVVFAWLGLRSHWSTEQHRASKVSAILLPTTAALVACGALAHLQLARPIPARDYGAAWAGLLLSFSGTVLGLLVTLRLPRWFSSLAFGASAWMLVPFFLATSGV